MTAIELLRIAREGRPNIRYATNDKRNTIGAWIEEKGRFVPVAGLLLGGNEVNGIPSGEWCSFDYEILANGKPLPIVWVEG